jgi:hypothetical protein
MSKLIGSVITMVTFILLGQPTKVDLTKQGRSAVGLIELRPGPGTMIVCANVENGRYSARCTSQVTGNYVLYKTRAPIGPGPCELEGTGALAFDTAGYMYTCTVKQGVNINTPAPLTKWLRSTTPIMVDQW